MLVEGWMACTVHDCEHRERETDTERWREIEDERESLIF